MATRINSSLVPDQLNLDDSVTGINIIYEPIPSSLKWPQWVNNQWKEYSADDDPMVIASRELENSYKEINQ